MSSTPPPLPSRTSSRHSAATSRPIGRSAANETTNSSTYSRAIIISVIVGLVSLLFILLILLAIAGIGIGWGMTSTSQGAGQLGEPTAASTNDQPEKIGVASEEQPLPTDSSSNSPSPAESAPTPTDEPRSDSNEQGLEEKEKELDPTDANTSQSPDATESNESQPQSGDNESANSESNGGQEGSGHSGSDDSESENVFSIGGGSFFGLKAEKGSIVYVVDCSGSMVGAPYDRARNEILRSVKTLRRNQAYFVILFSDFSFPMYYPDEHSKMVLATPDNFKKLQVWLNSFAQPGGTEPSEALLKALAMRPKTIFFLTDGGFDPRIVDEIRNANTKRIRINTIAFVTRGGEHLLKAIAEQNRGEYLFVP